MKIFEKYCKRHHMSSYLAAVHSPNGHLDRHVCIGVSCAWIPCYKEIWSSMLGEELQCLREIGNIYDLYAVKVVKTGTGTVGHLPKEISMPYLEMEEVLGAQLLGYVSTPLTYLRAFWRYPDV